MSEMKTIKFPGDAEPRVIVDGAAVHFDKPQGLSPEKQAQARANIGVSGDYYITTREDIAVTLGKPKVIPNRDVTSACIWGLYDALMEKYQGRVQKIERRSNDGTFTNYEYVISTGEYNTEGRYYGKEFDGYHTVIMDKDIKKPKYLILAGIHGFEKANIIAVYRFIRDVLEGRNVPEQFREGCIISVMPVGTPYSMDRLYDNTTGKSYSIAEVYGEDGTNEVKAGKYRLLKFNENFVNINRNFKYEWAPAEKELVLNGVSFGTYSNGTKAESEKETQAIVNWLTANKDAELFLDCHNQGSNLNELLWIIGGRNPERYEIQKKIAMRGIDRVVPFWRDGIGYPDGTVFYSTDTSLLSGFTIDYAREELGIPSLCLEVSANPHGEQEDWQTAIIEETVAVNAEVIGNILIEFYMGEVVDMTETNEKIDALSTSIAGDMEQTRGKLDELRTSMTGDMYAIHTKLDQLLGGTDEPAEPVEPANGFRIETGTYTAEEDIQRTGEVNFPCSPGAKIFVLVPDDATRTTIVSNATNGSFLGYIWQKIAKLTTANITAEPEYRAHHSMLRVACSHDSTIVTYDVMDVLGDNTNGFVFTVAGVLKAGTYNWKAIYWNEPEEA